LKTSETMKIFERAVIANYTRLPIVIVRGKGAAVWDADGRRYLDLFPGWAVNGIGHCHPRVVRAIKDQAGKLLHVANNFYMEPQGLLAREIVRHGFPSRVFFCNSGAEANEAALKLARLSTPKGRYKIITTHDSFHGRTLAAITATGQKKYQKGFGPLVPGFVHVPYNNIAALRRAVDKKTCAIMLEPIQGEGGINVAGKAYLRTLRKIADGKNIMLILDEVQTGMGRTGKMFAYQHYGIRPDIMTLAKALGGGAPIGAMVARPEVAAKLVPGTHASTFGGNPLVTRAGLAVFEAIDKEGLLTNARKMGAYAMKKLRELARRHDVITEVRGKGLMIGVQLSRPGAPVVSRALELGLLINCTHESVLRFMPPMTIKQSELDRGIRILDRALTDIIDRG